MVNKYGQYQVIVKKYGRYEVVEKEVIDFHGNKLNALFVLGEGGQAIVYLADDPRLGRQVALKVIKISEDQLRNDKWLKRFYREAQVMASLTHPAIVPIYDFGEQNGRPYLVMSFMGGGTLRHRLKKSGTFSIQQTCDLFERLAPALDMAHQQRKIIHRDLNPANILLDEQGNPFIADFGLVKLLDPGQSINSLPGAGTRPYMSPEQTRTKKGFKLDHRSDIYSLGIILFELLTGKWPYKANYEEGYGYLHNHAPIPNICEFNPKLPAECQPIIERVLAKQPADRYNSVGELVEALKKLTQTDAVEYVKRGNVFYKQRQYDFAIVEYTKAVHKRADYSDAYLNRGHAYYSKGEYGLAIADYGHTLGLTPDYVAAYYWRGKAQQERRHVQQAIADYDAALHINRNYTDAYFQRALAQQETGRFDLAIADYEAILRIKPNNSKAQTQRDALHNAILNDKAPLNGLPRAQKVHFYVNLFKSDALLHSLPPKRRAAIGIELAELGDPRPEVMTIDGMEFCYVPPGPFWMGSNDDGEYDHYKPLHQVDINYGYWIGRYPVTNAQYQAFVDDGGYRNEAFWSEAKAQGYWKDGKTKDWSGWRDAPYDWGTPYTLPNHPRVGITWYEALAFTRWLREQWPGTRLPSEAEWEKAARGGLQIPVTPLIRSATNLVPLSSLRLTSNPLAQRHYPWGNDFDADLSNCKETGIKHSNAVGAFTKAKSPYGAEEMSGNVWEWCQSLWKSYDYSPNDGRERLDQYARRVLRGGLNYANGIHVGCFFATGTTRTSGAAARVFGSFVPITSDLWSL